MGYQTGVLEALRDWGLTVVEAPGCRTRGSSSFDPFGHVVHHDVIGHTETLPSIMVSGRPDLSGPLCNFWLPRSGKVHVVALGRANHAGSGGWNGLTGNSRVWGTEMNNLGGPADPWPDAQLEAMARLAAATADFSGFPAGNVCGHKEWAPTRKIDPHSIWMPDFRQRVANEREHRELSEAERDRIKLLAQQAAERRPFLRLINPRPWMGEQGREHRNRERSVVSRWQQLLGLTDIDGVFGPGTSRATAHFQRAWGLYDDDDLTPQGQPKLGAVDQATWELAIFFGLLRYFGYA